MIKVLLVDDHAIFRAAVKKLLEKEHDIEVGGEARDGEEALKQIRQADFDVVLLDISMPGMSGIEVARRLVHIQPAIKVIALTAHEDKLFISQLLSSGAAGYLTKSVSFQELVKAIHAVYSEQVYITPHIAEQLASNFIKKEKSPFDYLTHREVEVLLMVCHGEKASEIAKKLFISTKTVNGYRQQIFKKLGVESDLELTKLAVDHGLLDA